MPVLSADVLLEGEPSLAAPGDGAAAASENAVGGLGQTRLVDDSKAALVEKERQLLTDALALLDEVCPQVRASCICSCSFPKNAMSGASGARVAAADGCAGASERTSYFQRMNTIVTCGAADARSSCASSSCLSKLACDLQV